MKTQTIHQDLDLAYATDEQYTELLVVAKKQVRKLPRIPEYNRAVNELTKEINMFERNTKDTIKHLVQILKEHKDRLGDTIEEQRYNARYMLYNSLAPWSQSYFKPHTIARYTRGSWMIDPTMSNAGRKGALKTNLNKRGAGSPNYPKDKLESEYMSKKAKLLEEQQPGIHQTIREIRELHREDEALHPAPQVVYANLSEKMLERIVREMDTAKKNGFDFVRLTITGGEVIDAIASTQ